MKKVNKHTEVFFSSFIDDLNNSPEMISETLQEHGVDEKALEDNANQLAGRLLAQMRIAMAKEAKAGLLTKAKELLRNVAADIQHLNPSEKLYNLLKVDHADASFTFNSLKDFSDDDVLQMLSEIELLGLIEELEKQKG